MVKRARKTSWSVFHMIKHMAQQPSPPKPAPPLFAVRSTMPCLYRPGGSGGVGGAREAADARSLRPAAQPGG